MVVRMMASMMNGGLQRKPWSLVERAGRPVGLRRRSLAGWIVACLVAVATLQAADDTVVNDDPQLGRPDVRQHSIVLDQQITGMLFGQFGGNEEAAIKRLSSRARLQLAGVDTLCGLTERQRRKGEAAIALAVAEIVTEVEAVRRRYEGRILDMQQPEAQAEWQRVNQEIVKLRPKIQGVVGGGELLSGVIATMLDDRQRLVWQREMEARDEACWRRVVGEGLATLDLQLGLTAAQRDAIAALLDEKPLRFDENTGSLSFGHSGFGSIVCRYALSLLDQQRLRKVVDDRQWAVLSQVMAQGKAMAAHLKQQKIILD
jgi:hypothetical protein